MNNNQHHGLAACEPFRASSRAAATRSSMAKQIVRTSIQDHTLDQPSIDISEPVLEICRRLGLEWSARERLVANLEIEFLRIRILFFVKDETGQVMGNRNGLPYHELAEYPIAWKPDDPVITGKVKR